MSDFRESLGELSREGKIAYDATDAPADYSRTFAAGVRRIRRRRTTVRASLSAVAVLSVAAVAVQFVGATEVGPADPKPTHAPGEVVWSLDLGTEVWSSPIVTDGNVVVGGNDGIVRAVDLATGDHEWEFEVDGAVRAEVAVADGALLVNSDGGSLYALSDQGEELWRASTGNPPRARDVYDGYASRPVVAGDTVIVGSRDGTVYAFGLSDGQPRWTFSTSGAISADIAYADGVLFVPSQDSNLYALDAVTGLQVWSASLGAAILSSPAVDDGVVVTGSRSTKVVAFDARTGEERWSIDMAPSWAEAAVTISDGVAYFGSSAAGTITAVSLATGEVAWQSPVGGWPWARPTVSDGHVYATSARLREHEPWNAAVYALDVETGMSVWTAPAGEALRWSPNGPAYGVMTSPAVADGLLVVAGLDGVVYAFAR